PLASAIDVNGDFSLTSAGIAGVASAALSFAAPSITVTGNVVLQVNTTGSATVVDGSSLDPGVRVEVTGASISISGQTLGAGRVELTHSSGGELSLVVEQVQVSLGGFLTVTPAHDWGGVLLVTSAGAAASFTGALGS